MLFRVPVRSNCRSPVQCSNPDIVHFDTGPSTQPHMAFHRCNFAEANNTIPLQVHYRYNSMYNLNHHKLLNFRSQPVDIVNRETYNSPTHTSIHSHNLFHREEHSPLDRKMSSRSSLFARCSAYLGGRSEFTVLTTCIIGVVAGGARGEFTSCWVATWVAVTPGDASAITLLAFLDDAIATFSGGNERHIFI